MASIGETLAKAAWISGPEYAYGADDAGYYEDHPKHLLRKSFVLDGAAETVHLCCAVLGYVRLWVNGERMSADELVGEWTNPTKVVYARSWDITKLLRPGTNEIVAELGNGFWNPAPLTLFGRYSLRARLAEVGTPKLALALAEEGSSEPLLVSDGSWECAVGPLLFNNPYLGERADLRAPAPVSAEAWDAERLLPVCVADEKRHIEEAPEPCCRRGEVCRPQRIFPIEDPASKGWAEGSFVVDFGHTLTGFAAWRFRAHEGDIVQIRYAETAGEEGLPLFDPNFAGLVGVTIPHAAPDGSDVLVPGGPGAPDAAYEQDVLICREGENSFESTFSAHSFRYALVEGMRQDRLISAQLAAVHTALARAGELAIANPHYGRLYEAAVRTKLNNVHGIWEDCARERLGYGGDMVALAESNCLLFDCEGMIRKTVRDMRNDQTTAGGIPETAPYVGIQSMGTGEGEGPLLWQLAYPFLILKGIQHYGMQDLAEAEWPHLEKMARYLMGRDPEEFAEHCLGDHGSIETHAGKDGDWKGGTPDRLFTSWCAILWIERTIARIGTILKKGTAAIRQASSKLEDEICRRFRHEDGSFGDRTQTSYAFAGGLGLMDRQEAGDALARCMEEEGNVLSAGIFGASLAWPLLHETGHDEAVEAWLNRCGEPSYEEMLASGNGVLAEQFHAGFDSYNHAMFSSYVAWMHEALGGIAVAPDAVGADHLVVRPYFSPLANQASLSYRTPSGEACASWKRSEGKVSFTFSCPAGIQADLVLPEGLAVSESVSEGVRTVLAYEQ